MSSASSFSRFVALAAAAALGGCGIIMPPEGSVMAVRQTIDDDYYASKQIGTPDSLGPCYPKGERLVLTWRIPKEWLVTGPLELKLEMMYRDHSRQQHSWEIWSPVGSVVLACLGECYDNTCGFLTYNIQLFKNDELLLEQPHNLWFEWIEVSTPLYDSISSSWNVRSAAYLDLDISETAPSAESPCAANPGSCR